MYSTSFMIETIIQDIINEYIEFTDVSHVTQVRKSFLIHCCITVACCERHTT